MNAVSLPYVHDETDVLALESAFWRAALASGWYSRAQLSEAPYRGSQHMSAEMMRRRGVA